MSSNPEDVIISEILDDARKQADRILRRAKQQADKTVKLAEEQARNEAVTIVENARKQAQLKSRSTLASIDQKVKQRLRIAREDVLSAVKAAAWKSVATATADSNRYAETLVGLICESVRQLRGDRFVVAFRSEDSGPLAQRALSAAAERLQTELGRAVTLDCAPETLQCAGGCIVWSADKTRVADQTFEARMARLWGGARQRIASVLFPEMAQVGEGA